MSEKEKTFKTFTTPLLVILLLVASFLVGMMWTRIRYIEQESKRAGEQEEKVVEESLKEPTSTIGNFLVTEDEVCQEDDKPVVYLFGSERCPHCTWEHPIFEKVTAKFGDLISVHDNMDKPEADQEIWQKYSEINQGAIPFLVLGCRYVRVGSGEGAGEVEEEKNLTALICKLTEGEPEEVCGED